MRYAVRSLGLLPLFLLLLQTGHSQSIPPAVDTLHQQQAVSDSARRMNVVGKSSARSGALHTSQGRSDTIPPTVTILYPEDGDTVSVYARMMWVQVSSYDEVGVVRMEFLLDTIYHRAIGGSNV